MNNYKNDLDWLTREQNENPSSNKIFFIEDRIQDITSSVIPNKEDLLKDFKSFIKKHNYELQIKQIKNISDSREKINKISLHIREIECERKYINDNLYYDELIKTFQNICPNRNYENVINAIKSNTKDWNLLSIIQYIQEIEDMIKIFPNREGELQGKIKNLQKLTPNVRNQEYRVNFHSIQETDLEKFRKQRSEIESLVDKAMDETPIFQFFLTKADFREYIPKEKSFLNSLESIPHNVVDSNGYSKPLKITSSTLTTFDIYLQLSIPNIMFFLSKLKEKYSPNYMQKIFEIIAGKIDFLEPYEKETLEMILTYGFYENFIVTSHIIPAFCEKLFTTILISKELDLNVVKGDLVEKKQMTQYFNPSSKEYQCLTGLFEETDLYDLYIILIEMNFRNDLYHGKESKGATKSCIAFYLWYVFSRLILRYKKS